MKRTGDERGASASVWMAMLVTIIVLAIGIAVDLTGLVNAQQRTFDLAQQAGRAGTNQVQVGQAMQGINPDIDLATARTAALGYLRAAGVTGSVTITGPRSLHVHATATYQPKFLGVIGLGPRQVSGDADISLARVVNGGER